MKSCKSLGVISIYSRVNSQLKQGKNMNIDLDTLIYIIFEYQSFIFLRKKSKMTHEEIEDFVKEYLDNMSIIEEWNVI